LSEKANHHTFAQLGLRHITDAVLGLLVDHPEGLSNVQVAEALGLKSSTSGGHRNYVTWSILSALVEEGRVEKTADRRPLYRVANLQDPSAWSL